jgi:uncharacterized protein (TIGR02145 family)
LWKNENGTNETGFNAKPGGACNPLTTYGKGDSAYWWSSSEIDTHNSYSVDLGSDSGFSSFKSQAYSVRCIKDK